MRVYIDTGLFIDYLSRRGLVAPGLRSAGRRGRTLDQVFDDAERVLARIAWRHEAATSALTFYEVEEATYKSLVGSTKGVADADAPDYCRACDGATDSYRNQVLQHRRARSEF